MAISTRSFLDLPNELIEEILRNVPDLHSVHSASQVCTRLFHIYQASQLEIMRSTILRIPGRLSESKVYDLLRMLQFVIKQTTVQREVARSIFQDGWKLLAEIEYEQLLIPFGKALAWSYALDKRESEAIHLLQNMWDKNEPFLVKEPRYTRSRRPSTLLPVKRLLDQLHPMDDSHSPTTTELQEFQEEVPIAKICPGEIEWNTTISHLDEFQQTQLLKNGILFQEDFIMIKFSPMMPTLESAPPTPLPTMTTYHFRSNTTSARALVESLDDELVTKLRDATWWSTEIRRYGLVGWKDDNR